SVAFGSNLPVVHVGVFPVPALVINCSDVPSQSFNCKGLVAVFKFTPAFAVISPAELDLTFDVSTHDVPFQRRVLSVAVAFGSKLPVVQVGVFHVPALVRNCPDVPAEPFNCNGLV